jgi:hypothetical protein
MNKLLVIVLTSLLLASTAYAADPGCEAKAAAKKLAGAAKNSFITKCQKDAAVAAHCARVATLPAARPPDSLNARANPAAESWPVRGQSSRPSPGVERRA